MGEAIAEFDFSDSSLHTIGFALLDPEAYKLFQKNCLISFQLTPVSFIVMKDRKRFKCRGERSMCSQITECSHNSIIQLTPYQHQNFSKPVFAGAAAGIGPESILSGMFDQD